MTTREEIKSLVSRMQECFNTRCFDEAAELHEQDFVSHPLGASGFEPGKKAWQVLVARYPDMRVMAQDIVIDGDRAAVRSLVDGVADSDAGVQPMLFEIFRFSGGRFAEMWGASANFPVLGNPETVIDGQARWRGV